jgi:hypothetical protein
MRSPFWTAAAALVTVAVVATGCDPSYTCGSQRVTGEPVEGCTDPFSCDYRTCTVTFGECGDASLRVECEGSGCHCYDGEEEIAACDYQPDQCPTEVDVELDGDDTSAMTFFETCCQAEISSR